MSPFLKDKYPHTQMDVQMCQHIASGFFLSHFAMGELMCVNYDVTSADSIQMWLAICESPCEYHHSGAGFGKRDIFNAMMFFRVKRDRITN